MTTFAPTNTPSPLVLHPLFASATTVSVNSSMFSQIPSMTMTNLPSLSSPPASYKKSSSSPIASPHLYSCTPTIKSRTSQHSVSIPPSISSASVSRAATHSTLASTNTFPTSTNSRFHPKSSPSVSATMNSSNFLAASSTPQSKVDQRLASSTPISSPSVPAKAESTTPSVDPRASTNTCVPPTHTTTQNPHPPPPNSTPSSIFTTSTPTPTAVTSTAVLPPSFSSLAATTTTTTTTSVYSSSSSSSLTHSATAALAFSTSTSLISPMQSTPLPPKRVHERDPTHDSKLEQEHQRQRRRAKERDNDHAELVARSMAVAQFFCPVCHHWLEAHQLNFRESVYLCTNATCLWPLNAEDVRDYIHTKPSIEILGSILPYDPMDSPSSATSTESLNSSSNSYISSCISPSPIRTLNSSSRLSITTSDDDYLQTTANLEWHLLSFADSFETGLSMPSTTPTPELSPTFDSGTSVPSSPSSPSPPISPAFYVP